MLNLLPKDYKEKVRCEYIRRFFIVSLIGGTFVVVFFLVAIFPSYTSINLKKQIAEDTSHSLQNSSKAKDKNVVLSNIRDLENRLKIVAMVPGDKPTDYISKALELKTKNISIGSISYSKKDDGKKEIILEGIALTRSDLIDFSRRVKSSGWATTSDIPLSNLASDRNIPFVVTLTATSTPK